MSSLPPGITSIEQLSQMMNLDRLPPAMKSFILQQYGGSAAVGNKSTDATFDESKHAENTLKSNKEEEEGKKTSKKSSKPKLTPKPPAGPPPESALKAVQSNA